MTVTGRTMDELRRARDGAAGADLVEVRLDGVDRPDAAGALEGRLRPVVGDLPARLGRGRLRRQRAGTSHDPARRPGRRRGIRRSRDASRVHSGARAAAPRTRNRSLSTHTFGERQPDVPDTVRALLSTGAEVVKLAFETKSLSETLPLFELADDPEFRSHEQGHVLIAMGRSGTPTRSPERAAEEPLDLRGGRSRPGTDAGGPAPRRISFPPDSGGRRPLRRRRQSGIAFLVTGDAQRRVRVSRSQRRVPVARSGERGRLRAVRARAEAPRRQHHHPAQGRHDGAGGRGTTRSPAKSAH